jgi:signal transduction histidine kinase
VVRVVVGADQVTVDITDDGRGLPDDARAGVGLHSMRERAAEMGGDCRIAALPEGGTRVTARLPRSGHA